MTRQIVGLSTVFMALVGLLGFASPALAGEEAIKAGDRVKVTSGPAPIQIGKTTLATVEAGTELTALKVQGEWVKIAVEQGGEQITGWIHGKRLTLARRTGEPSGIKWSTVTVARLTVIASEKQRVPFKGPKHTKEELDASSAAVIRGLFEGKTDVLLSEVTGGEGTGVLTLYITPKTSHFWPPDSGALDAVHMWGEALLTQGKLTGKFQYHLILTGKANARNTIAGTADGEFGVNFTFRGAPFTLEPIEDKECELAKEWGVEGVGRTILPAYKKGFTLTDFAGRPANPVQITNPNPFGVTAGVRAGDKGRDLYVPPYGVGTVNAPNGRYDLYLVYSTEPDALFQGDSFTLKGKGVDIKLVKVVGGNYGIRRVK